MSKQTSTAQCQRDHNFCMFARGRAGCVYILAQTIFLVLAHLQNGLTCWKYRVPAERATPMNPPPISFNTFLLFLFWSLSFHSDLTSAPFPSRSCYKPLNRRFRIACQASKRAQSKHQMHARMKQVGNNLHDRAAKPNPNNNPNSNPSPDDPDSKPR